MITKKLIAATPIFILFFGINNYRFQESQLLFVNPFQVIENAQMALQELDLSTYKGVSYSFSGDYKNQKHAEESLMVLMPLVLVG